MPESIKELRIQGFKSLKEVHLELAPLTVMVGANGTGKSNLFDFFRMLSFAFGSRDGGLQYYVGLRGSASSLLYYGASVTKHIDASIKFESDKGWSGYDFSLSWAAPDNLIFVKEEITFQNNDATQPKSRLYGAGHSESKILSLAYQTTPSAFRTEARVFLDRFRKITPYHFHNTSEIAPIRLTQRTDQTLFLNPMGNNLATILFHLKENYPQNYMCILDTVRLVAPFIDDFIVEPEAVNQNSILLRWMDRTKTVFGPHQLSDGTLRAIAMITALMQPDAMLPNILLFDEPELGLHPQAVGLIASLIKATSLKRQVVVATQSPLLIREYAPEDIVVVEKKTDNQKYGGSHFQRLSAPQLGRWLKGYDLGQLYEMNVTGGGPK